MEVYSVPSVLSEFSEALKSSIFKRKPGTNLSKNRANGKNTIGEKLILPTISFRYYRQYQNSLVYTYFGWRGTKIRFLLEE